MTVSGSTGSGFDTATPAGLEQADLVVEGSYSRQVRAPVRWRSVVLAAAPSITPLDVQGVVRTMATTLAPATVRTD